MSGKGIIMEIASKHYIVLTPSGEFRKVPRTVQPNADIGDEIAVLSRRRVNRHKAWTVAAAALVMLILFPLVLVPDTKADPIVAYVTLDVNPSVEMGIGDEEQVKELRGLNAEGERVVSGIKYKGAKASDVAAEIVARATINSEYASGGELDIVIASVMLEGETDDPDQFEAELEAEIRVAVTKQLADAEHVTMLSAPQEVREEASKQGVSTGKMAVYLLAKSKNPDVKLDALKTQSIHEWTESVGGLKSIVPAKPKQPEKLEKPEKPAKPAESTAPNAAKEPASSDKPKEAAPDSAVQDDHKTRMKHMEEQHKREKEKLKELLDREKNGGAADGNRNGGKQQSGSDKGWKSENGSASKQNDAQHAGKPGGFKGNADKEGGKLTGGSGQSAASGRGDSNDGGSKGSEWGEWSSGKSNDGSSGSRSNNDKSNNSESSHNNGGKSGNDSNANRGGSSWNDNRSSGSKDDHDQNRGESPGYDSRGAEHDSGSGKSRYDDNDNNRDRRDDREDDDKSKGGSKNRERD